VRIGHERIEKLFGQDFAAGWGEGRMFGAAPGRNDPRNLRKGPIGNVRLKRGDDIVDERNTAIEEWSSGQSIFILREPGQGIEREEIVALLIDLPRDACGLQTLGISRPTEAGRGN